MIKFFGRSDDAATLRSFREGDTVRSYDNEDQCVVVGTFHDWLWLDPVDYRDAAPFTGRAEDYELVRRG